MQPFRIGLVTMAGAAAVVGLTASLLISAPTPLSAQPNQGAQAPAGGQRGQGKPEDQQQRQAELHARVAANLGITPERLADAFKQARKDLVSELLQQGKITQEQADRMTARIDQGPKRALQGPGPDGQPKPGARLGGPQGRAVGGVVAQALGMTPKALHDAILNGRSLLEIAAEKGITADQLRTLVSNELDQRTAQALAAGSLTEEQAAQIRARHQQQVEQIMSGAPRRGPREKPRNQ